MIIVGIDPGLEGGIAMLDEKGKSLAWSPMPVLTQGRKKVLDRLHFMRFLIASDDSIVFCEKGSGHLSKLASKSAGLFEGLVEGFCYQRSPLEFVSPATWQSEILRGTDKSKAASIQFVQRRWPDVSLMLKGRTKPHDGMADALCIALYGLRTMCPKVK